MSTRKADIIVRHHCTGECGRDLYLEGWNIVKKRDVQRDGITIQEDHVIPFRFAVDLIGHMEPAPDGCMMKLGDDWLCFWLSKPIGDTTQLKGGEIQLADRPQLSPMYTLCRHCLHLGGKKLFSVFMRSFVGGSEIQLSIRSIFGIMGLVVTEAASHNRARREKNGKRRS
jgi:hypothetical protein